MTDLVVVSLEVWDEVWRRNQHLIAGLLRAGRVKRVLFVEPAVDIVHDLRGRRRPERTGIRRVHLDEAKGELWALRPCKILPRRVDPGGDRRRGRQVVAAAQGLGLREPVLWVNDPGGAAVLALTDWPALYDITDDWLVADRPEAELARLRRQEAALLTGCRQVVVCSEGLVASKSSNRDVVLIPNAVDLAAYRTKQDRPSDLPQGPVALYLGTAHRDRVDVDLLVSTAVELQSNSSGALVLVGPAPLPRRDLESLSRAGVRVLGPRPSRMVPAYLQHAEVLVVPHVLTDFTASLDPIKAYEYRAARRPVISTPVPGFVHSDDPLVRSVSAQEFADAVSQAVAGQVPWTSLIPDDIPSWSKRVGQMAEVIDLVERGGA